MDNYEELIIEANKENIDVYDTYCLTQNLKGLYCDRTVAISKELNTTEKRVVMAEELGHHFTSYGNILDQNNVGNRKQEQAARLWAYRRLLPLDSLIQGFNNGCRNKYELSEFLDVTEDFLIECIACYQEKYGLYYKYKGYLFTFNGGLNIIKFL